MGQIVLAPARGQAQGKPVGRTITNAAKAGRLDEGFQQINRVLVKLLPIVRNPARHPSQQMAGQVPDFYPRQY